MFRGVPRCSGMFRSVPWCSGVFRNVPECSGVFRNVPECSGVFRGVPGCSGMFRSVPGCSVVFRGVPVFRCSGVPVFLVLVHAPETCDSCQTLSTSSERNDKFPTRSALLKRKRQINACSSAVGKNYRR